MAYDSTAAGDPFNFSTDVAKAKTAKPYKNPPNGDDSKTVTTGRALYIFPKNGGAAEREDKS